MLVSLWACGFGQHYRCTKETCRSHRSSAIAVVVIGHSVFVSQRKRDSARFVASTRACVENVVFHSPLVRRTHTMPNRRNTWQIKHDYECMQTTLDKSIVVGVTNVVRLTWISLYMRWWIFKSAYKFVPSILARLLCAQTFSACKTWHNSHMSLSINWFLRFSLPQVKTLLWAKVRQLNDACHQSDMLVMFIGA